MASVSKDTPQLASHDIGLIFVREYYTFLNKKPHRLHAFYNKDSVYVRGDEGTISTTVKSQEEIRKAIEACQFEDCKVLITQVDSQASANDGILIQVLGEMSNRNGPSQKFSQTFFLATQPNGYYVLNDIFRFLKDEVDISYYTYEQVETPQVNATSTDNNESETKSTTPVEPIEAQQPTPSITEPPVKKEEVNKKVEVAKKEDTKKEEAKREETKKEEIKKEEAKREETKKEDEKKEETKKEDKKKEDKKKEEVEQEEVRAEEAKEEEEKKKAESVAKPEVVKPVVTEEKKKKPEHTKKSEQKQKSAPTTPTTPTTPTAPAKPSAPKTWANLTAAAVTPAATGAAVSTTPTPTVNATTPTPTVNTTTPSPTTEKASASPSASPSTASDPNSSEKPIKSQNRKVDATQIFVKSVTEVVDEEQLLEAFNKIGQVKTCSISRPRNCAFIEFTTPEGCQKALAQHKVQLSGGHTVLAEERRYNQNNTNRYNNNNQGRNQSFEQRRSNNSTNNNNNHRRQNNQRQNSKGRTTPSNNKNNE